MKNERKKHIRTKFSTEDKREFMELTLVELRKGETTANIAVDLGICEWSVQDNIKKLIADGRITKEEIDKSRREKKKRDKFQSTDIQKILKGLRNGKNISEIEREVSYAYTGVKYNIKWLIDEGYITKEEIDAAIEERRKREQGEKPFEEQVLELLLERKSCAEIAGMFDKSATHIQNMRKKFIADGRLEDKRGRTRRNVVKNVVPENVGENIKERYLEMLFEGISPLTIQAVLKLNTTDSKGIKDGLIEDGKITQGIINERRKERDNRNKDKVFRLLMQGYSQREIAGQIKYARQIYVQRLIEQLKTEGRITDKMIEEAKFEHNEREIKEYVLRKLKEGYSQQEITDNDETGCITSRRVVQNCKEKLVVEGAITDIEIEKAKKKRKPYKDKDRIKNSEGAYDERILKLMNLGFGLSHISDILELNVNYVRRRRDSLKLKKKINQRRIDKARKNRENMANERRSNIKQMLDLERDLNPDIVQNHIEYAKGKFHLCELEEKDVKLIGKVMITFSEFITMGNVNFVVTYYTREQKYNEALRFISGCNLAVESKEMREKLEKAKKEIELNVKRQKAERMLKEGQFSIEIISGESGLSTIEVIKLKKKMEENSTLSKGGKKQVPEGYGDDGEK